jgi:hypothetical protein
VQRRAVLLAVAVVPFAAWVGASWAADPQPTVELTITQPAAKATLSGSVEVRVQVKPADAAPTYVHAGLSGPPFVALARMRKTNEWIGKLDTTLVPNGETQVVVIAAAPKVRRAQQTATVSLANPLQVYFGDLHAHSYYSDGAMRPVDALTYARKVARLDFFVLTDHVGAIDEREWAETREQAWKANEDGRFVAFPGIEWSSKAGHVCLFDPPGRKWPTDLAGLYQAAKDAGAIGQFNHPGTRYGDFDAFAYSEVGDAAMRLVEVRSEPEERYFIEALGNGWHLAPTATDDSHSANWGTAGRWTGVLATGLSRLNVWTALKERHCYSTLDRNCLLDFRVNGAVMGEVIAQPVPWAKAVVVIADPDRTDSIAEMELIEDGKVIQSVVPGAQRCRWESAPLTKPGRHYYFVRVAQADKQKLWSAPVWVTIGR